AYTLPHRRYLRISFDKENTARLSQLIAPYVVECLNYKLIPEHRAIPKVAIGGAPEPFYDTFSVEPAAPVYSRSCQTVYCLSVEPFNNFVTLSGVVHNCRPPGNRPPQPDEAEHCREWLERTLELVRPRFICALGNTPARHLLGLTQGITKLR